MEQSIINYSQEITAIKNAILKSRYNAAHLANREMLLLYFSIGEYISHNSREGFWGTNAIEVIAEQLQKELPGLRGFSASNIKNMRAFYEAWASIINDIPNRPLISNGLEYSTIANRQIPSGDLQRENNQLNINRQTAFGDLNNDKFLSHFLCIGFSSHSEVQKLSNLLLEILVNR